MPPGQMNRTETRYADHLETRKRADEIIAYWFEPMSLRLAAGTFYRPDFMVMLADGLIEVHEVKGYWREDARIKIKVASEHFPFRFIAVRLLRPGVWEYEKFFKGETEL